MANLKPKQEQAAFLLASGMLGKDVANTVGVTPETISSWRKDENFEICINRYRLEYVESARERLRLMTGKALSALEELIDKGSTDTVKLKACSEVIKHAGFKNPEQLLWGIGRTSDIEAKGKKN